MPVPVTIVVPTYGRPAKVERLLGRLCHQTVPAGDFAVVVVCDGGAPAEVARLRRAAGEQPFSCRVIATDGNRGPGPARNVGWRSSTSALVAFIDDDCEPDPGWLAAGVAALRSDRHLGVVQGRTAPPPGIDRTGLGRWQHGQVIGATTPYFEACNIFYRRAALEAGGFSEGHARWGEDSEAAWAAIDAGWRAGFAVGALATHDWSVRGARWYARCGLGDRHMVALAKRHPGYRSAAFWRPWAIRRSDALAAVAVTGLVVALRWPPAALAAWPWLRANRPSVRDPSFVAVVAEHALVDGARLAGAALGSIRHRCFVL